MPKVIIQNILGIDEGLIAQQVNCRGVMGKGLALQIRKKHPAVYEAYIRKFRSDGWRVGEAQFVVVRPKLVFANLAGQDDWRGDGVKTNYDGLFKALSAANLEAKKRGVQLFVPFGLGAGLAGGDWNRIWAIIDECAADALVCRLDG